MFDPYIDPMNLRKKLQMAGVTLLLALSWMWNPAFACAGETKSSKIGSEPLILAEQEGAGEQPVAVRVYYDVDKEVDAPKLPISVFINLSSDGKSGEWQKVGSIYPFGPVIEGQTRKALVSVPATLRNAIAHSQKYPVAIGYGDAMSSGAAASGITLQSATVIRD